VNDRPAAARGVPAAFDIHAGHSAVYVMRPALKHMQHPGGILLVTRLAENLSVEHDDGVGSDHDRAGLNAFKLFGYRQRLAKSEFLNNFVRTFGRFHRLIGLTGDDDRVYAQRSD
jgi:hypothetical protein